MKTSKKTRNYGTFYALLNKLPGDKEYIKETLVLSASNNRTSSLRELTDQEYANLLVFMGDAVGKLNKRPPATEQERRLRSLVLKLLDKLGVHVVNDNWDMVNNYLLSNKISGKLLYEHDEEELRTLIRKLNSIIDKKEKHAILFIEVCGVKISMN